MGGFVGFVGVRQAGEIWEIGDEAPDFILDFSGSHPTRTYRCCTTRPFPYVASQVDIASQAQLRKPFGATT